MQIDGLNSRASRTCIYGRVSAAVYIQIIIRRKKDFSFNTNFYFLFLWICGPKIWEFEILRPGLFL